MASSAIKNEEEKKEYFDPPDILDKKIRKLAKYILKSGHFICFTGAGISTSCGIPDFRSGYNTVLPTGPGAWEELSEKKPAKTPKKVVRITQAIPSSTHMSFVRLLASPFLKHLVSQNVDGLHRKSGVPSDQISELHGNIYIEKCSRCQKEYLRDVDVVTSSCATDHRTGNRCDNQDCAGELLDNIINFGENLNPQVIQKAFEEGARADLCLALGSSLRVNPAAQIPKNLAKRGGKLVIVNLQKTPLDDHAKFVIHAFCDVVMEKLMQRLGLEIPEFRLRRYLKIERQKSCVRIVGVERDDSPFYYIKRIGLEADGRRIRLKSEPYVMGAEVFDGPVVVKLRFQANYGEPSLRFEVDLKERRACWYMLEFNPFDRTWGVSEYDMQRDLH